MAEQHDAANNKLKLLLAEELEVITQFKTLLQSEQDNLVAGNTAVLPDITASKSTLLDRINALSSQQLNLITSLGFKADKSGMADWVRQCPPELREFWDAILNLALEIKGTNQVNGKLINTRLQFTQQTLASLMAAANQANLYGPNGQPAGKPQSKNARGIIGKA